MKKLIDEFRHGWQGISQPSLLFSTVFATGCLALSTIARWGIAQIRPDVFFTPYFPAVFLATAIGGARIGIATAIAGGALGATINFSSAVADSARLALLLMFWAVCGFAIWSVEHYRTVVVQQAPPLVNAVFRCSTSGRSPLATSGCTRKSLTLLAPMSPERSHESARG